MKKSAPKIHHFFTVSFSPFTSSWVWETSKQEHCCSEPVKKNQKMTKWQVSCGQRHALPNAWLLFPENDFKTRLKPPPNTCHENALLVGFGIRGLLWEGVFSESPCSRDSRELRDSRDSREPPDSGKQRRIRFLEIWGILESPPLRRPTFVMTPSSVPNSVLRFMAMTNTEGNAAMFQMEEEGMLDTYQLVASESIGYMPSNTYKPADGLASGLCALLACDTGWPLSRVLCSAKPCCSFNLESSSPPPKGSESEYVSSSVRALLGTGPPDPTLESASPSCLQASIWHRNSSMSNQCRIDAKSTPEEGKVRRIRGWGPGACA